MTISCGQFCRRVKEGYQVSQLETVESFCVWQAMVGLHLVSTVKVSWVNLVILIWCLPPPPLVTAAEQKRPRSFWTVQTKVWAVATSTRRFTTTPSLLLQQHIKDPSVSAKSVGDRLHLNTHTPLTQWSLSWLTILSRHCVGTCQGNVLTCNSSETAHPRSSHPAKPLWSDPGLGSEISVCKLIPAKKEGGGGRKKKAGREWFIELPPPSPQKKVLAVRKKPPPPPPLISALTWETANHSLATGSLDFCSGGQILQSRHKKQHLEHKDAEFPDHKSEMVNCTKKRGLVVQITTPPQKKKKKKRKKVENNICCCDLDLEERKLNFLYETSQNDNVPTYQVWSWQVQQFKYEHKPV